MDGRTASSMAQMYRLSRGADGEVTEEEGSVREKIDFSTLTACGECCTGCAKKQSGACGGCIEMDGYVPEWAESGRCRIHACTRAHQVNFCGVCPEFPCAQVEQRLHWKTNVVEQMQTLAERYRQHII